MDRIRDWRGLAWAGLLLLAGGCQQATQPPLAEEPSDAPVLLPKSVGGPPRGVSSEVDVANLFSQGRWVDLTHPFNAETIYWPTAAGFRLSRDTAGMTAKGYYYSAYSFAAAEHGGTHVDAPIHFAENHPTVDQLPLEQLIGPAAVIDVAEQCARDRDYQVSVADLRAWEERHGRQLVDVIVLLGTGLSKTWPDAKEYLGTDKRGAEGVAELHFPGLEPQAAQWLVEQRQIKSIGIESASIDYGPSTHFESHQILFKHNVPAFENVAQVSELPEWGAMLFALPMKIGDGTGAPARIVAWLPKTPSE